ncbi:hypothetical protein ACHHYP_16161 [Achlya hypogyna]|uniref:Transmembrane protein n=1 Tax=Achlya hypogyna TaxID=1202772 RepID=A0A1V9Y9F9_ACHHY|nr:hypothetical protein ACHHYP_16161 [Achlya hypogyna]
MRRQVWPLDAPEKQASGSSLRHLVAAVAGLVWVWLGFAGSLWYIAVLSPSFSNDFWWPHYNASGYQVLLVDVVNTFLQFQSSGPINISSIVILQTYAGSVLTPIPRATYTMGLATHGLSDIVYAILNLRNLSAIEAAWLPTQYCWVDFDQRWELAHTVQRQARCAARMRSNGAVFLEATLRNQVWYDVVAAYGAGFEPAIERGLAATVAGQEWLVLVQTANATVVVEVDFWRSKNISTYELQWQNYRLPGLDESLVAINALGIAQPVTLKAIAARTGPWTTVNYNFFFLNDVGVVGGNCNMSLVRGTPRYFLDDYCMSAMTTDFEGAAFMTDDYGQYINQSGLSHAYLGPFLSVDMWVLPVPVQLRELYALYHTRLHDQVLASSTFSNGVMQLPTLQLHPTPPTWRNESTRLFYGGSMLCLGGSAFSYVQAPFSALTTCEKQSPLTVSLTSRALLFSLAVLPSEAATICALQTLTSCTPHVDGAIALLQKYPLATDGWASAVAKATAAVAQLNISLIQYATDEAQLAWSLLWLPVLEPSWAFYGWNMLLEWVDGAREVVAFEGDAATLVLVSDTYTTMASEPSATSLSHATTAVYYLVFYSTGLLGLLVVGTTVIAFVDRLKFQPGNLVHFYRVAGSTWLGRPLLFIRGCTALLLLGTAPIAIASTQGTASIELPTRPLFESMLLAWEATWITYVLQELLLPFDPQGVHAAGYISTAVAWATTVLLTTFDSCSVVSAVDRQCSGMTPHITCTSVRIQVGSANRVLQLLVVQTLVVPVVVVVASHVHRHDGHRTASHGGISVSGVGHCFLVPLKPGAPLDPVAKLLSGLIQCTFRGRSYTFDTKLWTLVQSVAPTHSKRGPSIDMMPQVHPPRPNWLAYVYSAVGVAYIAFAIAGSASYLRLAEATLTNDLIWVGFNISGGHSFLAKWFLRELPLHVAATTTPLDEIRLLGPCNATAPTLAFADYDGALLQYTELTSLLDAIEGLRTTPACNIPGLFTAYCYVDFDRRWSVAHSAAREARCKVMATNGAVYMEAFLRNVVWSDWISCWGEPFEIGISEALSQSELGLRFLSRLGDPLESASDEALYWKTHGISAFVLQWQNYKHIGLVNAYVVTNAYGDTYPFTLQSTATADRSTVETSRKMYWGLQNDFLALLNNASGIGGASLVRNSALYPNTTLRAAYVDVGVLPSPLSAALAAVETFLGPFGTVDMQLVAVPKAVRSAVAAAMSLVDALRKAHPEEYAAIPHPVYINPVPTVWRAAPFWSLGGSVLCVTDAPAARITVGLQHLVAFDSVCSMNADRYVTRIPSQDHFLFAAAFAIIANATDVCLQAKGQFDACYAVVVNATSFLAPANTAALHDSWGSQMVAALVPLRLQLLQIGQMTKTSPVKVFTASLLDDPQFAFFAYMLVYDWVVGNRQVVRFHGDVGEVTLLGDGLAPRVQSTDPSQLPTVFSLYSHRSVQYVTYVMMGLAATTGSYIVRSRGRVDGLNMLELSRVGGIVWVGRPLLLLRSITALCLLSTSRLELVFDGHLSGFTKLNDPWYSAVLAANEVTWLAGVVNDIGLVVTQELASVYATVYSVLVWLVSACVTILAPVNPSATVDRHCHIQALDAQITCTSGVVRVGAWQRLLLLVGIVFACNAVCFGGASLLHRRKGITLSSSVLLSGGAKFLFDQPPWMFGGVYHMDRASALLNGLLSVRHGGVMYVFDVKTWRLHEIRLPDDNDPLPEYLSNTIPMHDAPV